MLVNGSVLSIKYTILPTVFAHLLWLAYALKWLPFLIHHVEYDVSPTFAAITASTLLGKVSTKFGNEFMGIFDRSFRSTFVKSHSDVGWEDHACSLHTLIHPSSVLLDLGKDSVRVVKFIPVLRDFALCTGGSTKKNPQNKPKQCLPIEAWHLNHKKKQIWVFT